MSAGGTVDADVRASLVARREQPHSGPDHEHPHGRRVRLLFTDDEHTNLQTGDEGSITFVDSTGTVFVGWDQGSSLGLIPGQDRWEWA